MARTAPDLTREAWLDAGQAMLRTAGLKALRLRPLAEALGVSTGSFYHHFEDFDAYLGRLADYYAGEQLAKNLDQIRAQATTPRDQILRASEFAIGQDLPRLALAMRAWAQSDPRAKKAVEAVDSTLMAFFAERLEALGFSPASAAARAFLLLAASSFEAQPPGDPDPEDFGARILAILCDPGGAA